MSVEFGFFDNEVDTGIALTICAPGDELLTGTKIRGACAPVTMPGIGGDFCSRLCPGRSRLIMGRVRDCTRLVSVGDDPGTALCSVVGTGGRNPEGVERVIICWGFSTFSDLLTGISDEVIGEMTRGFLFLLFTEIDRFFHKVTSNLFITFSHFCTKFLLAYLKQDENHYDPVTTSAKEHFSTNVTELGII